MSAIHRLGLTIASVAAVITVAGAFVVQGYVSAQQAAKQAAPQAAIQSTAPPTAAQSPEIVYVTPPVPAAPAPTLAPVQPPPVIHVVVPGPHGDDEGPDG